MGERWQSKGVGEQTHAPAAPHARYSEHVGERCRWLVLPKNRQGQKPMRRPSSCLDLGDGEQNFVGVIADIDEMRDTRSFDRLISQAKPAAFSNILRQCLVFDELNRG